MAKSLIYVTRNELKFRVAGLALRDSGIGLAQKPIPTPEIQSSRVEEVAEWSAAWASQHLDQPVIVTDAGFYIEALNGFPGPFIKYVNEWFSAEDYLRLMQGQPNRRIRVRDCLAYCQPEEKPVLFWHDHRGLLAIKPGRPGGTPIEQLYIPEGYPVPISEIPPEEMVTYWSRATTWQKLRKYLEDLANPRF